MRLPLSLVFISALAALPLCLGQDPCANRPLANPETCTRSRECICGHRCESGVCGPPSRPEPLQPSVNPPTCTRSIECMDNFRCEFGRCEQLRPTNQSPSFRGLQVNSTNVHPTIDTCRAEDPCANRPLANPETCTRSRECICGHRCESGVCGPRAGATPRPPVNPPTCTRTRECMDNFRCEFGRCEQSRPTNECESSADCEERGFRAFRCEFCECVSTSTYGRPLLPSEVEACEHGMDCPLHHYCQREGSAEEGQCIRKACEIGQPCLEHDDCMCGLCSPTTYRCL